MRKWIILASAAATMMLAPASTFAQGFSIDTPVGGVRIGEPYQRHYYNDWDSPRVYRSPGYVERDVYLRGGNCRTVTIQRDDGSFRRIRRCD
jgi:hypothetical protein